MAPECPFRLFTLRVWSANEFGTDRTTIDVYEWPDPTCGALAETHDRVLSRVAGHGSTPTVEWQGEGVPASKVQRVPPHTPQRKCPADRPGWMKSFLTKQKSRFNESISKKPHVGWLPVHVSRLQSVAGRSHGHPGKWTRHASWRLPSRTGIPHGGPKPHEAGEQVGLAGSRSA